MMDAGLDEKQADKTVDTGVGREGLPKCDAERVATNKEAVQHNELLSSSRDGVKLYPQPTADPLDPLNWSALKKHVVLGIVMYL